MSLDKKTKRKYQGQAQQLKPTVMIGDKGLTGAVQQEIDRALNDHELIKIRISGTDRGGRQQICQAICAAQAAELIQTIGHVATFYRKAQTG